MLPRSYTDNNPTGCCPMFSPAGWDKQKVVFKDKLFIKDANLAIFHIPLNIGQVIGRMWDKVKAAKAEPKISEWLLLSYDPSPWRTEQYMPVTKEVPGAENVKLNGTFFTRLFEGPYQNAPVWAKETEDYIKKQGHEMKKLYFFYTSCPKCSKYYGKNYVVAFGQVKS